MRGKQVGQKAGAKLILSVDQLLGKYGGRNIIEGKRESATLEYFVELSGEHLLFMEKVLGSISGISR